MRGIVPHISLIIKAFISSLTITLLNKLNLLYSYLVSHWSNWVILFLDMDLQAEWKNSVDQKQLASEEASCLWSTLFLIESKFSFGKARVNTYNIGLKPIMLEGKRGLKSIMF